MCLALPSAFHLVLIPRSSQASRQGQACTSRALVRLQRAALTGHQAPTTSRGLWSGVLTAPFHSDLCALLHPHRQQACPELCTLTSVLLYLWSLSSGTHLMGHAALQLKPLENKL